MDGSSVFVAVMPITTVMALFTGIALPFTAASRPGRKARPRKPGATDTAPAGYLYLPCARTGSRGGPAPARRWVQQVPIVKTTARRIYYASDSWDRREAVISPGCISREQFETDTRCRRPCPGGARGARCAQHGHTREHCPHGDDRCRRGYPAGVIPVPGDPPGPALAVLRHPRGRRRPPAPPRTRPSRAGRTARTAHQPAAPRHGRRPPRPRRHTRAVHPGPPPLPGSAAGHAKITPPARPPPGRPTAPHQEQMTIPATERPPVRCCGPSSVAPPPAVRVAFAIFAIAPRQGRTEIHSHAPMSCSRQPPSPTRR